MESKMAQQKYSHDQANKKLRDEIEDLKAGQNGQSTDNDNEDIAAEFMKEVAMKAETNLPSINDLISENKRLTDELLESNRAKPAPTTEVPSKMLMDSFQNNLAKMKSTRASFETCLQDESSSIAEQSSCAVSLMNTLMQTCTESVNFLAMQTPSGDELDSLLRQGILSQSNNAFTYLNEQIPLMIGRAA